MTRKTIAVLGGTGETGQSLTSALLQRDVLPRIVTRKPRDDIARDGRVEVRAADLADVVSLVAAVEGADAIHYIPPGASAREEEFGGNVILAAETSGVSRLVYHSVLHPGTPEMPHHMRKALVEARLRRSTTTWTVLHPGMYSQSPLIFFDRDAGEMTPGFRVTRKFTPVHLGDISEAAALIHTTEGHAYATYELAGSELIDCVAMARHIGNALSMVVKTRAGDPDKIATAMAAAAGFDDDQRLIITKMLKYYDAYGLVGNPGVLRMLLGREPTSFEEAMREVFAANPMKR